MLALSLNLNDPDDHICIGPDVKVYFVEIRGSRLTLSIEAPRNVSVDRAKVRRSKLEDAQKVTK